ncbi:uncharacterized protein LOC124160616 [Ischnura elegans]|uniref:uncharacterized protein LOC124160616 n=1 Tax=Ischnura elegans TaxID=197161 RepID=UPI001ED874A2|nr:uncharacterized protein LOC124160616 [Ischnura elegans]
MALSLEDGVTYLNHVFRKLQVAIAVAVIRTRPETCSTEEYITSLKASVLQQPFCLPENVLHGGQDCHMRDISQQQEALFSKLWAVVPTDYGDMSKEKIRENSNEIDISQDIPLRESLDKNAEDNKSDDDSEADANVRFIEAVVQLKSFINSRSTIPANKFKDVLELFLSPEALLEDNPVTGKSGRSWSNESIPCCALGYVLQSSETNELLCLSFERVLKYLGQSLNSQEWDGHDDNSLIAHAIKTIGQLIEMAGTGSESLTYCQNACLKFATTLIDQLTTDKDMNKAYIWERHCTLVLRLCKAGCLRDKMISHIIDAILKISEDFLNGLEQGETMRNGCGCCPSFEPHTLENCWYMFYVWKKLMASRNEAEKLGSDSPEAANFGDSQKSEVCNIGDLWRLNWKGSNTQKGAVESRHQFYTEQGSFDPNIVDKWREKLNHYIKALSFHLPLFTYELYECEKLL